MKAPTDATKFVVIATKAGNASLHPSMDWKRKHDKSNFGFFRGMATFSCGSIVVIGGTLLVED